MKDIVIIGAGGFGREVAWLIEEINKKEKKWNIIGFIDESQELQGKLVNEYKCIGGFDFFDNYNGYAVCAVGDPITKKMLISKLKGKQVKFPVLIHPNVLLSNTVDIGEGSIICASNIITVNIEIGKHVIINLDCTIGHDAIINDYSTILPSVNVSGYVNIGECVSIGTGSAIIQGKSIGENTIIGAGAVVVKDIPANCTAVGSPAKPIKFN